MLYIILAKAELDAGSSLAMKRANCHKKRKRQRPTRLIRALTAQTYIESYFDG